MKRYAPLVAALLGAIVLALLLPAFTAPLPHGLRITRDEARSIADVEARRLGINLDRAWVSTRWEQSPVLEKELRGKPDLSDQAWSDPAIAPRMSYFVVTYYRRGVEKSPTYGSVAISGTGRVIGARLRARAEEKGTKPQIATLRGRADEWLRTHQLPGVTSFVFDSARPYDYTTRTDHTFRYRVPTRFPLKNVALFVNVYFIGDRFAGWDLAEEYADGRQYYGEMGGGIAGALLRYAAQYVLLFALIGIFLKKYHAGEVGVETSALLFGLVILSSLLLSVIAMRPMSEGVQMGNIDAPTTAIAFGAFKLLFNDIPLAVLVFLTWSLGESYARERWGDRLASFDALLRRDPVNATVGRSVFRGLLYSPLVAAAVLIPAWLGVRAGFAAPTMGDGQASVLSLAGPLTLTVVSAIDALSVPVIAILFFTAYFHRRRLLPLGILLAVVVGVAFMSLAPPVAPLTSAMLLGFGGILACVLIFLAEDLMAVSIALFGANMILGAAPLLLVSTGAAWRGIAAGLFIPFALLLIYALAGLATRRESTFHGIDLAPHVKRIIERERVKAEIDAANRIQAALLPSSPPEIDGAEVASHYCSATEIGGDYFDFLPLPGGRIGLAFGDVSGHGLTSGIVMSMAKAALLVQIGYDTSPKRVMEVLNEIVMKTAPKRILMTFFFGILDCDGRTLRFSSAGHLDPYVYRTGARSLEALSEWGFPLGVKRRDGFREATVTFEAGDRLILYSDGLIEAIDDDGVPFGFDRFEKVLLDSCEGDAENIKKSILQSVKKFTNNRPPEDDQTLVVISFEEQARAAKLA